MDLKKTTHQDDLPGHVAIIMDGNGRWAAKRGKPRTYGHIKGVDTVRKIVEAAARLGISYLTLYVFSRENWSRPQNEVNMLMKLFIKNIRKETRNFEENGIRLLAIGDLEGLPPVVFTELEKEIQRTANNKRLTLILAINYSGRREIVNAAREIVFKVHNKEIPIDRISESLFTSHLNPYHIPDPALVIRTSGENRISNFLLWQIAFSELFFIEKNWPDFTKKDFYEVVANYRKRSQGTNNE